MADLTGKTVKSTYKDLLKIDSDAGGTTNSGLEDGVMKDVTDGEGQSSALSMSTTQVKITDLEATTADINGGTIDGSNVNSTPIGDTTQSTAAVSSLDVGGAPTTDAHANIQREKSKTSISKEDVIFEKAGILAAMVQGVKGSWYEFLVIESHDENNGGNFVVEVEVICTSGVNSGAPGYNIATGTYDLLACEIVWDGTTAKLYTPNVASATLSPGGNDILTLSGDAGGDYGGEYHGVSLSGFGSGLTNEYANFHNDWTAPITNGYMELSYRMGIGTKDTSDNSFQLVGGISTPNSLPQKFNANAVPSGTYSGNFQVGVPGGSSVAVENFRADGGIFTYAKNRFIGMSRDLAITPGSDAAVWVKHKTINPEFGFSQGGWTNYWGDSSIAGASRMGVSGAYRPEWHNSYMTLAGDSTVTADPGYTGTATSWNHYAGGTNEATVAYTDGLYGTRWPKWSDLPNWSHYNNTIADTSTHFYTTGLPIWGNSDGPDNDNTLPGTSTGITIPYDADSEEHTREIGLQMQHLDANGKTKWVLSAAITTGTFNNYRDGQRLMSLSYSARVISSLGNGAPYVKKVYQADWAGIYT